MDELIFKWEQTVENSRVYRAGRANSHIRLEVYDEAPCGFTFVFRLFGYASKVEKRDTLIEARLAAEKALLDTLAELME